MSLTIRSGASARSPEHAEQASPRRRLETPSMIHHFSIPAQHPRHVAQVLTELFDGALSGFGPYPNSFIAWAGDEHGTAIEVYPVGTEMFPHPGAGQAQFRHHGAATGFTATHAAVSVNRSEAEIFALAEREGWRAIQLSRGWNDVIEFWIENRVMLELMTPAMAKAYSSAAQALKPRGVTA